MRTPKCGLYKRRMGGRLVNIRIKGHAISAYRATLVFINEEWVALYGNFRTKDHIIFVYRATMGLLCEYWVQAFNNPFTLEYSAMA